MLLPVPRVPKTQTPRSRRFLSDITVPGVVVGSAKRTQMECWGQYRLRGGAGPRSGIQGAGRGEEEVRRGGDWATLECRFDVGNPLPPPPEQVS